MGALRLQVAAIYYACLLSLVEMHAVAAQDGEWKSATATYSTYTDDSIITEGACGFGDLHKTSYGKYSAGLSEMLFSRGSTCGACFEVRCVDHILWCLQGNPSIVLTATDFCPPNYALPADNGGWCNFPRAHFQMPDSAFSLIAHHKAEVVPIQYRRWYMDQTCSFLLRLNNQPNSMYIVAIPLLFYRLDYLNLCRTTCERTGGIRFTIKGIGYFMQVLITNVGLDGDVAAVKVKGSRTGWIPMGRNWGQNWQCNINLAGQPLSFEVTLASRRTLASYTVAPENWKFGQTFPGKQF